MTQWQEKFARYIYQETGYVPDLQTLKLAMLLQKGYRSSPWNKARMGRGEAPEPLPQLPYLLDEIRTHAPNGERPAVAAAELPKPQIVSGITGPQARFIEKSVADWGKLKREMGEFWPYRRNSGDPITYTFTPEPQPDAEALAKLESKISAARNKAGRRKPTKR